MPSKAPVVERIALGKMKPAPYNPRTISAKAKDGLRASIDRFGLVDLPVWNKRTGHIVGGHQRYDILLEKGETEAEVIVVELSAKDEKALNVALNSPTIAGEFTDSLQQLLEEIEAADKALFDTLALDELKVNAKLAAFEKDAARRTLAEKFGAPPFSVLDAKQGYWQKRKAAWLALGILSELGRAENLMRYSARAAQAGPHRKRKAGAGIGIDVGNYQGGDAMPVSTSVFDPVLCELAYRWFCPERGDILDPFAGGSVRGVVASYLGQNYTGIDLRKEQVEANFAQAAEIVPEAKPIWLEGDSANLDALFTPERRFDFIFSCPPYGSLERYSDDPRDLSTMTTDAFRESYHAIIAQACRRLKDDRFACFVVGDYRIEKGGYANFVSCTIDGFLKAGLQLYNEAVLLTAVGSNALRAQRMFVPSRKLVKAHQNVLVFLKGDAKLATAACAGSHLQFDELKAKQESEDTETPS